MRPVSQLSKLKAVATRRGRRLKRLVDALSLPINAEVDRVVAFATIETLNLWGSFLRAFYISCFLGARRPLGGRVKIVVPCPRTAVEALTFAMATIKAKPMPPSARRYEPAWHDHNNILKLFTACNASNLPEVQAAFSYSTTMFVELPVMRNFFAHRNGDTAGSARDVARKLGLSVALRPSEILCSRGPGRPQNVLADWLDDFSLVADLLCQ
jgi:hypothetical protein